VTGRAWRIVGVASAVVVALTALTVAIGWYGLQSFSAAIQQSHVEASAPAP
jgi:hypothetical protein